MSQTDPTGLHAVGITPPPTIDELVWSDGEPMESERHFKQWTLLVYTLRAHWKDRNDFYVGGNMFFYYSALQARKNDFRGPDVFVVLGTHPGERKAWVVWEEDGKVPAVVIEIVSESTEREDRGRKMQVYAGLNVGEYFIYDPFTARLDGFRLARVGGGYEPMAPVEGGRLSVETLGLEVGVHECEYEGLVAPFLRWFEPGGSVIPTAAEALRDTAEALRDAERRASEAEAEVRALRARFGAADP